MSGFDFKRRVFIKGIPAIASFLGATFGFSQESSSISSSKENVKDFISPWSRPDNYKPNLTPGKTAVRLASWSSGTTLDYPAKGSSISGMVKNIRDKGYSAGNANIPRYEKSKWLEATDEEIRELKNSLKDYDVEFFDMHTTGSNINLNLSEREKCNKYTVEACYTAERVGAKMVTTHIGSLSSEMPFSPHPDNWKPETWRLGVKIFKQILKDSSGCKVPLGVEATNMTIMNNPRAHLRLIEEICDPRIKVCLDPVNMINMSCYYRNTELIEECFDILGENIIAAHAKDTYILPDKMSIYITEVPPGKGILDYKTYLTGLSRLSYPRTLLIEHMPDEEYPRAKKYIEDCAKNAGVKIYGSIQ